jgi:hypothetical protein
VFQSDPSPQKQQVAGLLISKLAHRRLQLYEMDEREVLKMAAIFQDRWNAKESTTRHL